MTEDTQQNFLRFSQCLPNCQLENKSTKLRGCKSNPSLPQRVKLRSIGRLLLICIGRLRNEAKWKVRTVPKNVVKPSKCRRLSLGWRPPTFEASESAKKLSPSEDSFQIRTRNDDCNQMRCSSLKRQGSSSSISAAIIHITTEALLKLFKLCDNARFVQSWSHPKTALDCKTEVFQLERAFFFICKYIVPDSIAGQAYFQWFQTTKRFIGQRVHLTEIQAKIVRCLELGVGL